MSNIEENKKTQVPKPNQPDQKPSYIWIYLAMFVLVVLLVYNNNTFSSIASREIYRNDFDQMYLRGDVSKVETINNSEAIVYISKDSLSKSQYKSFKLPKTTKATEDLPLVMKISSHEALEKHVDELQKAYHLKSINLIPTKKD